MTAQEARAIVAILIAAYPREAIEQPTIDLYTTQLAKLDDPTIAAQTVQILVDHSRAFPTVSEFREQYFASRRREAEERRYDRRRQLSEPERGPLPDWVKDFAAQLGNQSSEDPKQPTDEQRLLELAELPPGRCDDCGHSSNDGGIKASRFRYAKLALCRPCALSRIRVARSIAA